MNSLVNGTDEADPARPFDGRCVLVTGGGSGIGRATARAFAAAGASVAVVGRRRGHLDETVSADPSRMFAVVGDVARPGAASEIVAAVVDRTGRLDVLVNNAAIWQAAPVAEMTDEMILTSLMTNQFSVLALVREANEHLVAARGSIVNLSSTGTRVPLPANAVYAGTKAAIEQMTRNLAVDLGPRGVRVNAVAPGATDTEMLLPNVDDGELQRTVRRTPLGRIGTPDDIASVIVFLASDDAGWVTGQTIQVSGGLMI